MIRRDISIISGLLLAFSACTCTDIAGPDAQLREAAKGFERLESLPEVGLRVSSLKITRITPEPELKPPRVVFSFDLDGRMGDVMVSAIGVERTPMKFEGGRFVPEHGALPGLSRVLEELRKEPPARRWIIRVDVGRTNITEELADGTRRAVEFVSQPDGGLARTP